MVGYEGRNWEGNWKDSGIHINVNGKTEQKGGRRASLVVVCIGIVKSNRLDEKAALGCE